MVGLCSELVWFGMVRLINYVRSIEINCQLPGEVLLPQSPPETWELTWHIRADLRTVSPLWADECCCIDLVLALAPPACWRPYPSPAGALAAPAEGTPASAAPDIRMCVVADYCTAIK